MSGFQNQMASAQGSPQQTQQSFQAPYATPFQNFAQQFAAMQGMPMPNTQAARWNGQPTQARVAAPVNNTGMSTPGITSQLQALQSQLSSMQSAASAKSPGIRFRNDG